MKYTIRRYKSSSTQYQYSTPVEFVEMIGYATNETICKQVAEKGRIKHAACHSVCAADRFWFSDTDIKNSFGSVCEELNITNREL